MLVRRGRGIEVPNRYVTLHININCKGLYFYLGARLFKRGVLKEGAGPVEVVYEAAPVLFGEPVQFVQSLVTG
jgi:hypothetical protein